MTTGPQTTRPQATRQLADGLVLRPAAPADADQIGALLAARGEPADAVDHRLIVDDPDAGYSSCAVVADGDRVVSTSTLLDETLWLAGVPIPTGQVELVATDREYEGRGLVRALLGWAHERSAARGQLVQLITGIPYFYRQFGYAYAVPIPGNRPVHSLPPQSPGHTVRRAVPADIPAMATLQDDAQSGADLRMPHSAGCWRWLLARDGSDQWLAERDGAPVATGRATPPEEGVRLAEIAAADSPAAHALLRHACQLAGEGAWVQVVHRPGTVADAALDPYLGAAPDKPEQYYVRVPDPAAVLEHLRPVLSARLVGSPLADADAEAMITLFRSHLRFPYRHGEVGPVTGGGSRQGVGRDGAAVAPDLVAPLLFGPAGFDGLHQVHPDVYVRGERTAALMSTLFPPVCGDLLTFYLP